MPMNAATGRAYNGINIPLLGHAADVLGYPVHGWMSFKQALNIGAAVRKGEKATFIVYADKFSVKREEDDPKIIPFLKTYGVFNVAQIDGLTQEPQQEVPMHHRDDKIAAFVKATEAQVVHGGNIAAYIPSKDIVVMPNPLAFKTIEHYHATLLHELGHYAEVGIMPTGREFLRDGRVR
jgi:antirestriction protein ArdC